MNLSLTGRIDLDHGKFNNVLYVLGLSSNILSVYQMTHTGSPKKVIFSPDDVEITEISNGKVILMKKEIFAMKYLAILTTSIFLI